MKRTNHSTLFFPCLLTLAALVSFSHQQPLTAYVATEYKTTLKLNTGTLVSLGDKGQILRASSEVSNYLGVVTKQLSAAVEVADTGVVSVMVSDVDGDITIGDRVGVSDIAGTATLWRTGKTLVGVAKSTPQNWQDVAASSSTNQAKTVRVTSVGVQLMSEGSSTAQSNPFMSAIQSAADGVAGRSVDMWRVVTALLLGIGGLILSFGLLFVSSRESFFSLGRNPMASGVIMHGLWRMVFVAVLVMCASLAAAYFIVRIS